MFEGKKKRVVPLTESTLSLLGFVEKNLLGRSVQWHEGLITVVKGFMVFNLGLVSL